MRHSQKNTGLGWLLAALLMGCASDAPPTPDWKLTVSGAADRFVEAWLLGDSRIEQVEFERARRETASTGRADLVARIELLRCATRVASLVLEPCAGFEALRADLGAGREAAYADYLAGQTLEPQRIALLPEAQQGPARARSGGGESEPIDALRAIGDPLSRLVAAGVLFRARAASDATVKLAIDTASERGWRRPLLTWLGVAVGEAELAGDSQAAARARRRMELVAPAR